MFRNTAKSASDGRWAVILAVSNELSDMALECYWPANFGMGHPDDPSLWPLRVSSRHSTSEQASVALQPEAVT